MGAYWNICLPLAIDVYQKSSEDIEIFERDYSEYFNLVKSFEVERKSPTLPDGSRLTFVNKYKRYFLKKNVFEEFQKEYEQMMQQVKLLAESKDLAMTNKFLDLEHSAKMVHDICFSGIYENDITQFEEVDDSMLLNYYDLPPMVVYTGYPFDPEGSTGIECLSILSSYFKYGEYDTEEKFLINVLDIWKNERANIGKLLFLCAF